MSNIDLHKRAPFFKSGKVNYVTAVKSRKGMKRASVIAERYQKWYIDDHRSFHQFYDVFSNILLYRYIAEPLFIRNVLTSQPLKSL